MASTAMIERWKDRVGEATWNRRMKWLARFGYLIKGALYVIIGVLAFQAAWAGGSAGATEGSKGAIREIASGPFGTALMWLVALGLFGYALYRIVQAVLDPEGRGTGAKAAAKRVGLFASGIIHGALGVYALNLVTDLFGGGGGGGGGGGPESRTAQVMAQPWGRWLIGAIGLGVIVAGLWQLKRAIKDEVFKYAEEPNVDPRTRRWIHRVGRFGFAARFVTFTLIGSFLLQAAWQFDPSEAGGLGEALATIARQPWGQFLLGLVAIGLLGYAVYCFVKARYLELRGAT